jgi:hypothetical protein
MSKFKNLDNIDLYYSDTDSLYIKGELDSKYISDKELGKFKLEKTFLKALFLSAKMYAGKYINKNKEIKTYCKIKGLKHKVDFIKLLSLLFKNKHINLEQEKWHKDLYDSSMEIKNTTHKLEISSFKRRIIYNENNKFIDTKPINLKDSKIETFDNT